MLFKKCQCHKRQRQVVEKFHLKKKMKRDKMTKYNTRAQTEFLTGEKKKKKGDKEYYRRVGIVAQ